MALSKFDHLAMITSDLTGTIRFYRDLLGLELSLGIGHEGYRHYFFNVGDGYLAFFEYDGASPMQTKFHGSPTRAPLGFDHLAFTVDTRQELFGLKDQLEAADIHVDGPVDHGAFWSIYFFDPVNNIPLEASWALMEITDTPAIVDVETLAVAEEGAAPQSGHWPAVENPTPADQMIINHPGNAYTLREELLRRGQARLTADGRKALEQMQETTPEPVG